MKKKITFVFCLSLLCLGISANAQDLYNGCPNQGASDITGHLAWRIRNPTTNAIVLGAPAPNTIYKLEIYETPYGPVAPNYRSYAGIGIKGQADGFKLYQHVYAAQNSPNSYYSDAVIASGVGPDVGATGGVATFGIKTLPASDPNWTGQITAFKAYGLCPVDTRIMPTGGTPKWFYKVLIQL